MNDKHAKMPQHVKDQRAAGGNKPMRRAGLVSELHDVFRRIDMHGGDKTVCWEWRGAHGLGTRGEYRPRVVVGMKDYYVYRIVYTLYTGYELQPRDVIRHECDHSWCCNPYHMIIGTQADNVQDMLKRERVGMKHFHIKRVMQMLELGCTARYVCAKMREGYGMSVHESIIRKIRMRKIYKHIDWPWGDKWAADRKQRLAYVRKAKLAGDPSCGIIDNQHEGVQDDTEDKGSSN